MLGKAVVRGSCCATRSLRTESDLVGKQSTGARTPSVFHGLSSLVRLVLLGDAATHEVHVTGAVPHHLLHPRLECPLLSDEDVEVVVGGVEVRVSLRIERRAKDDQVPRNARVDHVHRPHRAARVVEHLFRAVRVDRDARAWVRRGRIGDDVRDHARRVVGRCGERQQLELVQIDRIKDLPSILQAYVVSRCTRDICFILENKERTLIVSSQLNVASVINRKMARVAHLVSGSLF